MARVNTYFNFNRQTEKAFAFYRSVFGGDYIGPVMRYGDMPAGPGMPAVADADRQLVMHIALPILGGHVLMGTDMSGGMAGSFVAGTNVHLSLEPDTRADTERLFQALAAGGKVHAPLHDAFWGGYFGSITDAFGIHWMFNCESKT